MVNKQVTEESRNFKIVYLRYLMKVQHVTKTMKSLLPPQKRIILLVVVYLGELRMMLLQKAHKLFD